MAMAGVWHSVLGLLSQRIMRETSGTLRKLWKTLRAGYLLSGNATYRVHHNMCTDPQWGDAAYSTSAEIDGRSSHSFEALCGGQWPLLRMIPLGQRGPFNCSGGIL